MPRVAFKIDSSDTLEYRVNDDDEFHEIEWRVGLCTGSGESGRRPRGDGGAPTDDGNGVGEHLNETESLFDSVAKQHITEESQLFRPLTAYRKPVARAVEAASGGATVAPVRRGGACNAVIACDVGLLLVVSRKLSEVTELVLTGTKELRAEDERVGLE
ncbi:hypothetical protein PF002_g27635 [Phytophthora fragariae]|uniref:Uncharacterized protein n=1 Tax=Phytophthora fragariae TaxID=53985 RepID=A0A6A3QW45_9STRA|nr:hypothetical protein PF006_g26457 [Phytophthora fragariae]KAE9180173.1 hypothetical protein PF002_g27635 [Phytophthora fragariae]